jgi:hypothetical protein
MRLFLLPARLLSLFCMALLLGSCVDRYLPEVLNEPRNFLVVDGFINSQGITRIKLSRTTPISTSSVARAPVEPGANVFIESQSGTRTRLQESPAGTYSSLTQTLPAGGSYRLFVSTRQGQTYASEYMPVKTTPPIDSVRWRAENTGVGIYVNSHDDTKNTRYYRWEFEETWEIIPPHRPLIEFSRGAIRPISVRFPTLCWGNELSSSIQISKTIALSQDVVADFPLQRLPILSPKLHERYSILVHQFALTKAEYEYWELLRKNTESIGSLFDPQPSQVTGNLRCLSKPDEVVLGFVGVRSATQKRIFINRLQLPFNWRRGTGYEDCVPPDTILSRFTPADMAFGGGNQLPINEIPGGWTASSVDCIDCRTRGTVVRPSFW